MVQSVLYKTYSDATSGNGNEWHNKETIPYLTSRNSFMDVRNNNDNKKRYIIVSDALSIDNRVHNINVNNQTNKYESNHKSGLHNNKVRNKFYQLVSTF